VEAVRGIITCSRSSEIAAETRRTSASASCSSAVRLSAIAPSMFVAPTACVRWCSRSRQRASDGAIAPPPCSAKPACPGIGPSQNVQKAVKT
tara:strand:+ start:1603 stop:1878 length:276 start_codon:yes stop_codon:yes gene_type:complete